MNCAKSNVARWSWPWLACALVACSSSHYGKNASADAGEKHADPAAQAPVADAQVATDAAAMSTASGEVDAGKAPEPSYTIYPVEGDTCPGTPFPPGFKVPMHTCPPADSSCHDGVCNNDADCTLHPRGHCAGFDEGHGAIENTRCIYEGCETHADCDTGSVCLCSSGWRFCLKADCMSDGDCPTGEHCIHVDAECSPGPFFVCTNPADQCRTASDCAGKGNTCWAEQAGAPLSCADVICGD
jgi:hypothetical protein